MVRPKKKKRVMGMKFSLGSFALGALGGVVCTVAIVGFVGYGIVQALESGNLNEPTGLARALDAQAKVEINKDTRKTVYGKIVQIGNGNLQIQTMEMGGTQLYTYMYTNYTQFVQLNNDADATESPIALESLSAGTGVTVLTSETIGSVPNQIALKVIKL